MRTPASAHRVALCGLIAAALAAPVESARQSSLFPETLWVKVTLYDYHCDGSNPNFQVGSKGKKPGMVQDTLSADLKPLFKADLCYNSRLNEWYRPSGSDATVRFAYSPATRQWAWTGLVRSTVDSTGWQGPLWQDRPADSMANIVFYDSLPFTLADSARGSYQFVRDNNLLNHEQFFWLDGRGFGSEDPRYSHNYSFAMELHHELVYRGGEFFEFRGDDDVWVFINGRLVADLGGTQAEGTADVRMDDVAAGLGLSLGDTCRLDFFYTERLAFQSNCVITTDMLLPLGLRGPSIGITAVVRDTNANGQFDRIDLIFPDSVSLAQSLPGIDQLILGMTFVSSTGEVIAINPVAIIRRDDSTISIILRETTGSGAQTGWETGRINLASLPLTSERQPAYVATIRDSSGPLIRRAELLLGRSDAAPDTIRVTFSEPVNCQLLMAAAPESVLVYYDNGVASTEALRDAVFAGTCTDSFVTEVLVVVNSRFQVMPTQDDVALRGGSPSVADASGMHPPLNGDEAPVVLNARIPVEVSVYPNPARLDRDLDSRVCQAYTEVLQGRTRGAIIGLYSPVPLKPTTVGSQEAYGTVDIYDAVGNIVRTRLPVKQTSTARVYGVFWDGKNRNSRLVGNGVYLAVVTTTDINGRKSSKRIKVGITR